MNIIELKEGNYIAFKYKYSVNDPEELIVSEIHKIIEDDSYLVFFMFGWSSESEIIKKEDILAVGVDTNTKIKNKPTIRLKGWSGEYYTTNIQELDKLGVIDCFKD